MQTHTLATPEVDLVYDVRPADSDHRPLLMIGQPMDATGFTALAAEFTDRTVITYDPRGIGRSVRKDDRVDQSPEAQAGDVHAVIEAVGGPVDLFASSGGAVTALALVTAYPDDVVTLVAHEPPLYLELPDAVNAERAGQLFRDAYQAKGFGAGMAAFMAVTSWTGEFTDEFFARPLPDPAAFGMPTEDDGRRDDPLLSDAALAIGHYRPDAEALAAVPTRVLIAVGEESADVLTGRAAIATARRLGQEAVVFPSHHGGFIGGDGGWTGQPEAFGRRLHELLDH